MITFIVFLEIHSPKKIVQRLVITLIIIHFSLCNL